MSATSCSEPAATESSIASSRLSSTTIAYCDGVAVTSSMDSTVADGLMAAETGSAGDGSEAVSVGNCTVVIVKTVQANHKLLRLIHEENGALPAIVADIAGETIDDGVRIAIKNEVLKKQRGDFGI